MTQNKVTALITQASPRPTLPIHAPKPIEGIKFIDGIETAHDHAAA